MKCEKVAVFVVLDILTARPSSYLCQKHGAWLKERTGMVILPKDDEAEKTCEMQFEKE